MEPTQERRPLTQKRIESLKAGATRYELPDGEVDGLRLRVSPGRDGRTRRAWTLKYRFAGQERRFTIGDYSNEFGVGEARKRARDLLADVSHGIDPGAQRDLARVQKEADEEQAKRTVGGLIDAYVARIQRRGLRSAYMVTRGLEANVREPWGTRDVTTITRDDIRTLVERKADAGAPTQANRVLSYLKGMFKYAMSDLQWRADNPAAGLHPPAGERPAERVLQPDEVRLILTALRGELRMPQVGADSTPALVVPFDQAMRDCLLVTFYTAQRGGEVAKMKWADLNLDQRTWTIPGSVAKNRQQHVVPLTDAVFSIITGRPRIGDYVFSRQRKNLETPRPATHVGMRLKRAASELSRAVDAYLVADARLRGTPLPDGRTPFAFKLHDARRTGATRMAEAGASPYTIALVLNHRSVTEGSVTSKHYMKYAFPVEKRAALDGLALWLDRCAHPDQSARVLAFAR